MRKSDIFWQSYLNLEGNLIDLGKYIFISDDTSLGCRGQLDVYSPYISDLLVSCCCQIESISKELYFTIGGKKTRDSADLYFDEDCLRLIDRTWSAGRKVVNVVSPLFNLTQDDNKVLKPLKGSGKRKGTYWEKAYQAVKHDRYNSIYMGNVKALIRAMAALYLLNIYFRNDSWVIDCGSVSSSDWSMGSSVFSVLPPVTRGLWYGNEPNVSDSPFVASYTDAGYSKICEMREKERKASLDLLFAQPEFGQIDFLKRMQDVMDKDPNALPWAEWGVYKINQEIPSSLSFAERKRLLLQNQQWSSLSELHGDRFNVDKVTEDSIQNFIDRCGRQMGLETMFSVCKCEWGRYALDQKICRIYIPSA